MDNVQEILGYFVVCIFVGFAACLSWGFVVNINVADPNVKAGLIGLFGMFPAAFITNYQTKKREIDGRHFADKREGYIELIDLIFDLIKSTKSKKELAEKQMLQKIMTFKKALLVWGGANIIEAWNNFEMRANGEPVSEEIVQEMEKILRLIRKDLGHDDSQLKFGNLSGLMLIAKDKKILFEK